ncbi:uncharacterized protein LOC108281013 [Ictalurus punctatus]|uniref:Uncharacterized protein LOC108281013 n=1 Tax=Ictalurus punctatus TaxID=7998 RepID=A0A2D0TAX8_ICTPU|nr:uncharacterized protein LOC108281013 [Ictalurus punctatus]XP_053530163.1 uncharacterized protein LOC108281013 [Ictalurus punctatus]
MGSASSHLDCLDDEKFCYIKEAGSSGPYQFKRTCVLDSLLAALHTTYLKYPNVKALLDSDELFRELMAFLSFGRYVEAKIRCVQKLKHVQVDDTRKEMDFYGSVYDHFVLLDKLVCEFTDKPRSLKDSHIYKEMLSISFDTSGCEPNVFLSFRKALEDPEDLTLILGNCSAPPLLHFKDEKKRTFVLQFVLLGKNDHMTMCFQSSDNKWHLYDNDKTKPPFQSFDLESMKDYEDRLGGYVNITQVQEHKLSVPETGEAAGTKCFCSGVSSSHLDPVEDMEVLPYSVAETGEGLGTKLF